MAKKDDSKKSFRNDPLFLEVIAEALEIQDRFAAEPIYAKTGKGYLKSVGVGEIANARSHPKSVARELTALAGGNSMGVETRSADFSRRVR